jgi:hypothetical protein
MHDVFGSATLDFQALASAAAASLVILPVTWVEERSGAARIKNRARGEATP